MQAMRRAPPPLTSHVRSGRPSARRASFIVVLVPEGEERRAPTPRDLDALITSCPSPPDEFFVHPAGEVAGLLLYQQWRDALDAVVFLWRRRLEGVHHLLPRIESATSMPMDRMEETNRLKSLFADHARGLLDCGEALRCRQRIEQVGGEIERSLAMLRQPNRLGAYAELQARSQQLGEEKEQLQQRLDEYRAAIRCVLAHLGEAADEAHRDEFEVFKFGVVVNWSRLHRILERECRRLGDGLPIYTMRRKLLQEISSNQVLVLIGETGSGKSTQLVQFLADSGLAADGSIACTQPRKIAATLLAQRVSEESNGCYKDSLVVSYPRYSSSQKFNAKVVYLTDHCLLQHCTNDFGLVGISFIIVDEAHERSLHTDLLLAIIKKKLIQRFDLKLVIMSATADASKIANYFDGCCTFYVKGRNFPVDIRYVPCISAEASYTTVITKQHFGCCAPYVYDVIKMVSVIHKTEAEGAILAFLTSQMEVEWACENFNDPSAVVLPLHGKLSYQEQNRAFQNHQGKRKVIFSTNIAETSFTIQGVKYVVDSGMAKESRFEPKTGMNVLKVCRISQSSAKQRAGRAGRTEPGKCYRLYPESDFQSMQIHQEPEIRKVHLGMAVLKIIALGINNIIGFEFVDAPSPSVIDAAIQNLIQLGAIILKTCGLEFTETGRQLVKLGIEPQLGKIILDCFNYGLKREGLVLAAVMANAGTIFCRVGSDDEKHRADCRKVPFCHRDGDLFTLLSVYKEWEAEYCSKNKWCWQNSINGKSMRRCQETVWELEKSLQHELNIIIPSYWLWNPHEPTIHDKLLKKAILSSLPNNIAMYSGYGRLGYEVASSGQYLQLHPSCSLLAYGHKPTWVVFGEILSASKQYLVCVTVIDYECFYNGEPPLYDISQLESHKLQVKVITGVGNLLLRRLCGKLNNNLQSLISRAKKVCLDNRIGIEVDFEKGEVLLFALTKDLDKVTHIVNDALQHETRWLRDECIEKYLYGGGSGSSLSIALFGSGAEIKHLELGKRYLTVEISHPSVHDLDDKEVLMMVDNYVPKIANFYKHKGNGQDGVDTNKWGKITFLNPEAAENAVAKLNGLVLHDSLLKVQPVQTVNCKSLPSSAVRAKVCWPRRISKGCAHLTYKGEDASLIISDCSELNIGGRSICFEDSTRHMNRIFVSRLPKDLSEPELYDALPSLTKSKVLDVHILRGEAVNNPPTAICAEALRREIKNFMPRKHSSNHSFQVEVFDPEPKDDMINASITFDGSLHLEAAQALDHLRGKVLPGFLPWQKMQCRHVFQSSVSCPAQVYFVIKKQLNHLLESFKHKKVVSFLVEKNKNGSYRVKISGNATKIVADLRKHLEQLMEGKTLIHPSLTPTMLLQLSSLEGATLLKSLERDTGTLIMYGRRNLNIKLFGPQNEVAVVEKKLICALLSFHEDTQLVIHLRGRKRPPDLMKEVVRRFGPDLRGLKEMLPGVYLTLQTRGHILRVQGSTDLKQKVAKIISDVACSLEGADGVIDQPSEEVTCPICLCELEEPHKLEDCGHSFCRACLIEQCESAMKSRDGFPLCCAKEGCGWPIVLADLRSLLLAEKLEELFRASLESFVKSSNGTYRFCPSPDCPSIYCASPPDVSVGPFVCGVCGMETCTKCHVEYHPFISCKKYNEFKINPNLSLEEWRKGKEDVKDCPSCGNTVEKIDGCNHVACPCGKHICWVCLESCSTSAECYDHLRSVHLSVYDWPPDDDFI